MLSARLFIYKSNGYTIDVMALFNILLVILLLLPIILLAIALIKTLYRLLNEPYEPRDFID
jgi:hypothetical protein